MVINHKEMESSMLTMKQLLCECSARRATQRRGERNFMEMTYRADRGNAAKKKIQLRVFFIIGRAGMAGLSLIHVKFSN